jgi:protoporphyrinogen oxidase
METTGLQTEHAIVIGAGLAGLAAARDLLRAGKRVTLMDASQEFGGLASTISMAGQPVERYYHFITRPDHELLALAKELEIDQRITWKRVKTTFYFDGNFYPFSTPFDLLFLKPVPWIQRLRFGIHVLLSRYRSNWDALDAISARDWLVKNIGERAYQVIWEPLLHSKFGSAVGEISAAWIWHRIWRVARSRKSLLEPELYGYFDNGSEVLIQALVTELRSNPNFEVRLGEAVQEILVQNGRVSGIRTQNGSLPADLVLSTLALAGFSKLLPDLPDPYFQKIKQIHYLGVVCVLMNLDRPFTPSFWMNIHDPRVSFPGIIEYTNLNEHLRASGLNLVYIPFYMPVEAERFQRSDEALMAEYLPMLAQIIPGFSPAWIKEWKVFRSAYAQAICTTNFTQLVPAIQTPIRGLFCTDSAQFYPEDRTLSAAIRKGREAAGLMINSFLKNA